MRMMILLVILHLTAAANKKQRYSSGRSRLVIESFNKAYFKYFKLSYIYHNRTNFDTKVEFDVLKTVYVDTTWLEISFYHNRNNEYHLLPIGRGIQAKQFLEENPFGIGDSIQKACPFPVTPGKHTIIIPKSNQDNSNSFQVPMFGDFKLVVVIKDGAISMVNIAWMGHISAN